MAEGSCYLVQAAAIQVRFPDTSAKVAAVSLGLSAGATDGDGHAKHLKDAQKAANSVLLELRTFLQHSQSGPQAVESLLAAALASAGVAGGNLDQDAIQHVASQVAETWSGSSGMRALLRQAATTQLNASARAVLLKVLVNQVSACSGLAHVGYAKLMPRPALVTR